MKIEFKKVSYKGSKLEYLKENLKFNGFFKKIDPHTIRCEGDFSGTISHICDRCAKDFDLPFKEKISLKIVEGITSDKEDFFETIECIDSTIDFDEIIESEIESFKSDYHYCKECKEKEKENKNGSTKETS